MNLRQATEGMSHGIVHNKNFNSLDEQLSHYLSQRDQQASREQGTRLGGSVFSQKKEPRSRNRFLSPQQ
jgi:hypothetical protein